MTETVLITGASSGIGLSTARLLTLSGWSVALVARSADKLQKLSAELEGSAVFVADVSELAAVRKMVSDVHQHFGRIDVLVNNAGQGYDSPIEQTDPDTFRHVFELDVMSPLVTMQAVIPIMRLQGSGSIINISSGTTLMALPNMGAYSSAKRALNGLSLTARAEVAKDHIAVSLVYPFITATDFEKNTIKQLGQTEWFGGDGHEIPPADTAEFVAEKILEAIRTGVAEVYVHEWMKPKPE